jgi:hypothetical protein
VSSIFDQFLDKNRANYAALSPVSFVERSAEVFGDLPAVIHGARRYDWRTLRDRSARLATALCALGVGRGTTVTTMLSNTPEMVEAHYSVPAPGPPGASGSGLDGARAMGGRRRLVAARGSIAGGHFEMLRFAVGGLAGGDVVTDAVVAARARLAQDFEPVRRFRASMMVGQTSIS